MNRVVLVTGSTRGIGFGTAAEFLKNGDSVVIFCRHREHVFKAKKRLVSAGPRENILTLTGDVRKEKDVKRIVGQCLKSFNRIDILIKNAGIAAYESVEETSERGWDDIIDTPVNTTLLAGGDLELDPSEVLAPEYVARRIFEAAKGRRKSGALIEVYS